MAEKGIVEKAADLAGVALVAYWVLCTNYGRFVLMMFVGFCIYSSVYSANTGVHETTRYDNGTTVSTRYSSHYTRCLADARAQSRTGIINDGTAERIEDCQRKFPRGLKLMQECNANGYLRCDE